jgi:hypothetical protein
LLKIGAEMGSCLLAGIKKEKPSAGAEDFEVFDVLGRYLIV